VSATATLGTLATDVSTPMCPSRQGSRTPRPMHWDGIDREEEKKKKSLLFFLREERNSTVPFLVFFVSRSDDVVCRYYYGLDVEGQPKSISFDLMLGGDGEEAHDADLFVREGYLPTLTEYDFMSPDGGLTHSSIQVTQV
jgi:hypothetical protein